MQPIESYWLKGKFNKEVKVLQVYSYHTENTSCILNS